MFCLGGSCLNLLLKERHEIRREMMHPYASQHHSNNVRVFLQEEYEGDQGVSQFLPVSEKNKQTKTSVFFKQPIKNGSRQISHVIINLNHSTELE